ncbi:glycosyltransferase family 2 protein [Microbacterium sp. gxy059]|uniref:glycosyltransferase family 2 protein n=1 Tax=Microbacterium sp. gxy059 TaxID=2957199 RepID=UPI003D95CF9D
MPAPVHAVLVARSAPEAEQRLERTLSALRRQTRPVDALTIVVCGDPAPLRASAESSGAEAVISAPETIPFGGAVELALRRVPEGSAVWLVGDDTAPEIGALAALHAALERQPSVAIAAPKLVRADDSDIIESLGVTMTRFGRSVQLAAGEFDQGQRDASDDVLGADVRGMLLRGDVAHALVPDRALLGVDEGLDMGVRARLGGRRVALAPEARVAVRPSRQRAGTRAYTERVAQLHRRLVYAPLWALPLHWLGLLPAALWATVVALLAKRPDRVWPEWAGALTAMVRWPSIGRSRSLLSRFRTGSWQQVDPLRISGGELRERQNEDGQGGADARSDLRFFSGGGAWAVLAALAVSVGVFIALLTWPHIAGGALLPLRRTVSGLWNDALYGLRPLGLAEAAPADPFSTVMALLGTLWPAAPGATLVALWLLALPLAVLGAWFAATRVADSAVARVLAACLWGVAPPFWDALMQGQPAAVIVHLALPWLVFAAAAAHRSWTAAGAGSLLLVVVLAGSPSLAPALCVLWAVSLLSAIAWVRRGIARIFWLAVPSAAMFAPLVVEQVRRGTPWALLADPVAQPSDGGGPLTGAGLANGQATFWPRFLSDLGISAPQDPSFYGWTALLVVPAVLLALLAPLTRRWRLSLYALGAAALGIATATAAPHVLVSFQRGDAVAVWPGAGLSLAWIGIVCAAAITLDTARRLHAWRGIACAAVVACAAVAVVPQMTALHRGATPLHAGTETTLPAYVAAEARGDRPVGTLVLTPLDDGGMSTEVVWGASETLSGQSTALRTRMETSEDDERLAALAADIVAGSASDIAGPLRDDGLSFVLLRETADEQNADQRIMSLTAKASMDARAGFVRVGETARGVLWLLDGEVAERAPLSGDEARGAWLVGAAQVAVLVVSLLLAAPTRSTRRAARANPRVIGAAYEEDA